MKNNNLHDVHLTEEQIAEVARCMASPEYFIETFCWLEQKASAGVSESSSIIPFFMGARPPTQDEINRRDVPEEAQFYFQRRILRWLISRENVLAYKARRVGCSWIAAAYVAWLVNFHQGVNVIFISRTGRDAKKILHKVKFILKNLAYHDSDNLRKATKADWLCNYIESETLERLTIGYHNDEGLVTVLSTVESVTTTDDAARGDDATFVVFDELAFYEHPDETWSSALKTLARGGHWFAISCVNPETYIFTEHGVEQIKDYMPSDTGPKEFSTIDNFKIFGKDGLKDCHEIYNNGNAPTKIITTQFNYQIECTHIHPILANINGNIDWVKAKELKVGDWIPIKKGMMCFGSSCKLTNYKPPYPENSYNYVNGVWVPPDEMTEDLAYLLGLLVGDGYIDNTHGTNNRITITNTDQEIVDWLQSNGTGLKFNLQKDGIHIVANQKQFVQFLRLIDFPVDYKAPRKYIPKIIMTAPESIVRAFLQGLFDTDGCATNRGVVTFVSSSEQLADQVRMLLLNFGVIASKSFKTSRPDKLVKTSSEIWVLEIGLYAREFFEKIGFRLTRKQERYEIVKRKSRSLKDIIPFAAPLVRGIRHKLPQRPRNFDPEVKRRRNLSNRILIKNDRKPHKPISYQAAREILDRYAEAVDYSPNSTYYGKLVDLVEKDYFWVQITDIKESESLTYDFCIRDGHSFVSNGLISHNTSNGVGDVFHRLVAQAQLAELGKLDEPLEYKFTGFIHWSEAGITQTQVNRASTGSPQDLIDQEWEGKFIVPGSVVFDPTHLAACYKPLHEHPELVSKLHAYRQEVLSGRGHKMYFSGVDTIVGRANRKSKEKDWNSFNVLTEDNIQAFHYYSQEPLSKWAGKTIDNAMGGRVEIKGRTSELHEEWPGICYIEEDGPGLTVCNNHQLPRDTFSEKHPVQMKALMKRDIIQRLVLKVESHSIVITDPWTYQCMMVFQNGSQPGQYEAPPGYNDDPVLSLAMASDAVDKHNMLSFSFGVADRQQQVQSPILHPYQDEQQVLRSGPMLDLGIAPENQRITANLDSILPAINQSYHDMQGLAVRYMVQQEGEELEQRIYDNKVRQKQL